MKLINRTKNGSLLFCKCCGGYHLMFGHFHFAFKVHELVSFKTYLMDLDIAYWEDRYNNKLITRKIPIPTLQENLCLVLNQKELKELKKLLFIRVDAEEHDSVFAADIDYDFITN